MFANDLTINIPIKIIIPVNTIAKFIPKGLNQDSFGAVINILPKNTDNKTLTIFIKIIKLGLIFTDIILDKIINKKVPKNAKMDAFVNIEVSM